MTPNQLKELQRKYKNKYGIGVVEFAETMLCTQYGTYKKWISGTNKIPGIAKTACAFLSSCIVNDLSIEQINGLLK